MAALTATQTAALAALAGRALTSAEVTLAEARQDNALAASISATLKPVVGSVSVPVFLAWCASTGLLGAITATAANTASPLYNSALAIQHMLGWQSGSLDLGSDPVGLGNSAMLQAWVTAGALTQAQHDALVALATTAAPPIQVDAVSNILNGP